MPDSSRTGFTRLVPLFVTAWMALAPGCSAPSSQPQTLDAHALTGDAAAACAASATNVCARLQSCSEAILSFLYGSVPACQAQVQDECGARYAGPGAANPPAACDLSTLPCAAFMTASSLPATFVDPYSMCPRSPGQLGEGQSCLLDTDCASLDCQSGSGCGHCAPFQPGGPGAACSTDMDCAQGLVCDLRTDTCATTPSPSPALQAEGASCTGTLECNLSAGLVCGASGKCAPMDFAPVGARCAFDVRSVLNTLASSFTDGTFDVAQPICAAGSSCTAGVCQPGPAEGDPCEGLGCGASFTLTCAGGVCTSAPYAATQCTVGSFEGP